MKLSILQWNVWYKEDICNIAAFLKEHPADVICLQEMTIQDTSESGHAPNYIAKQLGYGYFYKAIPLGEDEPPFVNGVFSKYPIVHTNWQWVNEAGGSGHYDDEYRAYVEVTIDVDGEQVTVATTHLFYSHGFVNTTRKEHEADRLVAILKTKSERFVLTGDLNAAPDSPTIQKVGSVLKNVGPDLSQKTWTTKPFAYDGFEENNLNWRLDYIFATPDVKTVSAEILKTDFSDHLPIWAEVELA